MKVFLLLLVNFCFIQCNSAKEVPVPEGLKDGDIIFSHSNNPRGQAIAVEAATDSKWTHTAVIIHKDGVPMVLEAVQPVQLITLKAYLQRGKGNNNHTIMRLKDRSKLTPEATAKAMAWGKKHIGSNYDGRFQWSDRTLYCSELVWKIYKHATDIELCKIKKVKEYNLQHPEVKKLIIKRFGSIKRLNLEEKIVAPSDIYESELLEEVMEIPAVD